MRIFLLFLTALALFSCSTKKDPPLIIPPNFDELPDPKNPEKPTGSQQDADIEKLKELLLKDD